MKINITKQQYKDLIVMSGVADSIFGLLGDFVSDDYKKQSDRMHALENYLLQFAKDFGYSEAADMSDGEFCMDDDFFEDTIMPITDDYDEYILYTELSNKLALRDFREDHTEEEIDEMAEMSAGYLGVPLYDYEKKYWDEFEENDYARLRIVPDAEKIIRKDASVE